MATNIPEGAEAQLSTVQESLQTSIHAATRSLHTQLNRSIMARMPLCIPPHAQDPTAYYLGIVTFGQIFEAFEVETEAARLELADDMTECEHGIRHSKILTTVATEGLERAERLQQDTNTLRARLQRTGIIPRARLVAIGKEMDPALQEWMARISSNIQSRPYLSLAYQWTMYLALFNGGRHLHRALQSAGPDFWMDTLAEDGRDALSFWTFDAATESDPMADALKLRFKANFDAASDLLTDAERAEVVEEAKSIFRLCADMVTYLDETMAKISSAQNEEIDQTYAQYVPKQAWRMWDAIQTASLNVVNGILPDMWRRQPLVQEVKE